MGFTTGAHYQELLVLRFIFHTFTVFRRSKTVLLSQLICSFLCLFCSLCLSCGCIVTSQCFLTIATFSVFLLLFGFSLDLLLGKETGSGFGSRPSEPICSLQRHLGRKRKWSYSILQNKRKISWNTVLKLVVQLCKTCLREDILQREAF